MATPTKVLLECLEDLRADDFKKFKWYLCQRGELEGFKTIPQSRLENADRMDTVDLMVKNYCINTIKVTRMVLGKINRNDLLERLPQTISDPSDLSRTKDGDTYKGPLGVFGGFAS
eukprot:superscaffoldBa00007686_g22749